MNIRPITSGLRLGRFPAAEEQKFLENAGVNHVLNVCESPSRLICNDRLHEIAWHPVSDSAVIPDATALYALDDLHRMVSRPGSVVYVHCQAGQQRAPTMLWLYLIACGFDRNDAARHIRECAPDTMPGHAMIVDNRLIGMIEEYGKAAFQPHPRADAIAI